MYFFGGVAPRVPSEEGSVVAELQTQPRVAKGDRRIMVHYYMIAVKNRTTFIHPNEGWF